MHLQRRHPGHRRGRRRRADGGDQRHRHTAQEPNRRPAGRRLGRVRHRGPATPGDDRGRPEPRGSQPAVLRGGSRRPAAGGDEQPHARAGPLRPAPRRSRRLDAGDAGPDRPAGRRREREAHRADRPSSGQAGVFTEAVVRAMARNVPRPVIFPLSNPTSRAEATPQHLLDWTEGRALIGVGSPFPCPTWDGSQVAICQTNNSYIFPGVGLGLIASGARRGDRPYIHGRRPRPGRPLPHPRRQDRPIAAPGRSAARSGDGRGAGGGQAGAGGRGRRAM
ncbi:MAG: malic enzyme-like NAD(P)-binding protein [Caulobacteraceae bacterium]